MLPLFIVTVAVDTRAACVITMEGLHRRVEGIGGSCQCVKLVFTCNVESRVDEGPAGHKCKLANNVGCAARGRRLCLNELRGHVELVARLALVEMVWDLVLVAWPDSRAEIPYDGKRVEHVAVFATIQQASKPLEMQLPPGLVLEPQKLGQRVPELVLLASMLIRISWRRDQGVCCEGLAVQKCLKDTNAILRNPGLAAAPSH